MTPAIVTMMAVFIFKVKKLCSAFHGVQLNFYDLSREIANESGSFRFIESSTGYRAREMMYTRRNEREKRINTATTGILLPVNHREVMYRLSIRTVHIDN